MAKEPRPKQPCMDDISTIYDNIQRIKKERDEGIKGEPYPDPTKAPDGGYREGEQDKYYDPYCGYIQQVYSSKYYKGVDSNLSTITHKGNTVDTVEQQLQQIEIDNYLNQLMQEDREVGFEFFRTQNLELDWMDNLLTAFKL